MSLWISWVRPESFPVRSRACLGDVEPGSRSYSAVAHPRPFPSRKGGAPSDTLALHARRDITTLDATVYAGRRAYRQANKNPADINLAEVHDCFTIAEVCAIEDLGFVEKGQGGKAVEDHVTTLGGRIPVNTSGGLKSKGHPVGATGVAQIVEVTQQLRGDAGERQVHDAHVGLTHNVGGSGATCVVHILEAM